MLPTNGSLGLDEAAIYDALMSEGMFTRSFPTAMPPSDASLELLDLLSNATISLEYRVTAQSQEQVTLRRDYRPWWVWALCVLLFPLGLLALLIRRTSEVVVSLREKAEGGSTVVVTGPRVKYIERLFDEIEDTMSPPESRREAASAS